jgi:hypothetical protein
MEATVARRPQNIHYHFHGAAPKDALGTSKDDPIDESDRAVYAGAGSNEADEAANAEDEYCSGGSPKRHGRKRKTGGQVDDIPVRGKPGRQRSDRPARSPSSTFSSVGKLKGRRP